MTQYVTIPRDLRCVASHFVLFTWLYDRFDTAPYIRILGDLGTGKSRLLRVLGDLCYKALVMGGGASLAVVFRALDKAPGTLVLDEADFSTRRTDHEDMMQLLRLGFERGQDIWRNKEDGGWNPTSFQVFGPKLIAGRKQFPDAALESRCFTFPMSAAVPLGTYPPTLPDTYDAETRALRNQLFKWRQDHYYKPLQEVVALTVEPRLLQVYIPLASVVPDPQALAPLEAIIFSLNAQMIANRMDSYEGRVVAQLLDLSPDTNGRLHCKAIAQNLGINPKSVSSILRSFGMETKHDRSGSYVVFDRKAHASLIQRYGQQAA